MANHNQWADEFRTLFAEGVKRYRAGQREVSVFFLPEELAFLATIGATAQEIFDFVEDYANGGDPTFETVLLITAVRRDYFLNVQDGKKSDTMRDPATFPAKTEELDGVTWLPRIIEKARTKLRGELPPETMYGCGGDRPFAKRNKFHLADFLRRVWEAGDDTAAIVAFVKESSAA